ncbi:MAG: hypothetical protein L0H81_05800, partial [Actinomyces sp.]|nr:hypothetical protein [Actinomyces sp.]
MTAFGGDRDLVRLPHGWRAQEVPVDAPPVDLFAVGPGTEGDRAPSVVVTHADGADGSLREWAPREVMGPDGVLATVRVLDSATLTVSGLPA